MVEQIYITSADSRFYKDTHNKRVEIIHFEYGGDNTKVYVKFLEGGWIGDTCWYKIDSLKPE